MSILTVTRPRNANILVFNFGGSPWAGCTQWNFPFFFSPRKTCSVYASIGTHDLMNNNKYLRPSIWTSYVAIIPESAKQNSRWIPPLPPLFFREKKMHFVQIIFSQKYTNCLLWLALEGLKLLGATKCRSWLDAYLFCVCLLRLSCGNT